MTSKTETQQLRPVMILCGHDTGFCQRTIIYSNLKMQMFMYWVFISKWYWVVSFSCLFNSDAKITIDNSVLPKRKSIFFFSVASQLFLQEQYPLIHAVTFSLYRAVMLTPLYHWSWDLLTCLDFPVPSIIHHHSHTIANANFFPFSSFSSLPLQPTLQSWSRAHTNKHSKAY